MEGDEFVRAVILGRSFDVGRAALDVGLGGVTAGGSGGGSVGIVSG